MALAAALLLLLSACQVQSGGDQASQQPSGGASGPLVMSATDVLGASAERFQQGVESLRAEMQFSMEAADFSMDASADLAFQAPDKMYLTMEFSGSDDTARILDLGELGTIEMLVLGTDIYMNMPPLGWLSMSLEEMGADADMFEGLLSDHSLIDYRQIIEQMGVDIEELGQETVDGTTYTHYRATADFADVMDAFSTAFSAEDSIPVTDIAGLMTIDIWVDPDDLLPYKLVASGEFGSGDDAMVFEVTMRFLDYNQPVTIPEPPANAQSMGSLFDFEFDEESFSDSE